MGSKCVDPPTRLPDAAGQHVNLEHNDIGCIAGLWTGTARQNIPQATLQDDVNPQQRTESQRNHLCITIRRY